MKLRNIFIILIIFFLAKLTLHTQSITNVRLIPQKNVYSSGEKITILWNTQGLTPSDKVKITILKEQQGSLRFLCRIARTTNINALPGRFDWNAGKNCTDTKGLIVNIPTGVKLKIRVKLINAQQKIFAESNTFQRGYTNYVMHHSTSFSRITQQLGKMPNIKVSKVLVFPPSINAGMSFVQLCEFQANTDNFQLEIGIESSTLSPTPYRYFKRIKTKKQNKTISAILKAPLKKGFYKIYCKADPLNEVNEISEKDNYVSATVSVVYPKFSLLTSTYPRYVSADRGLGGLLVANREKAKEWETFSLIPLGNNKFAIQTSYGKYVRAAYDKNNYLIADRDTIGEWEKFEILRFGAEEIAIKASNGKFVTVGADVKKKLPILIAASNSISSYSIFISVDKGGFKEILKALLNKN